MQIVIKNNRVLATHPDHVTIPEGAYPNAQIVYLPGPERGFAPGDRFVPAERRAEDKEAEVRRKRDALLAASDWTQLVDAPLPGAIKMDWAIYRQELRDLDMRDPVWPDPPGEGRELRS